MGKPTTRSCVLHPHQMEAIVCLVGSRNGGVVRDFCAECVEAGEDDHNFGRCYECADGYHVLCIGVPCQCECPVTPETQRRARIEQLRAELAALEVVPHA